MVQGFSDQVSFLHRTNKKHKLLEFHCQKTNKKHPYKKHTRQIARKWPPLTLISMIGIERIEYIEKKRFLYKNIF